MTMNVQLSEAPVSTLGAFVFLSYILIALVLTAVLCRDLVNAFLYQPAILRKNHALQSNIQVFAGLAILSFSVLSYHMLDFLIESYQSWALQYDIELPYRLYGKMGMFGPGHQRTPLHLWSWMTTSTLFRDFAQALCEPMEHYWWTSQTLMVALMLFMFMSEQGPKKQIPHLWAYALIGQVLPISFTQNLFCLAMLMTPRPKDGAATWVPAQNVHIVVGIVYAVLLGAAPFVVGSPYFLIVIGAIRCMLFAPFLLSNLPPRFMVAEKSTDRPRDGRMDTYVGLLIAAVYIFCIQTIVTLAYNGFQIASLFRAINGDPAVSALAYDYILSLVSGFTWYARFGSSFA